MNQMTERLFEALAIRKQKQEQDRKEKLEKINPLTITPIEALNILNELKQDLNKKD